MNLFDIKKKDIENLVYNMMEQQGILNNRLSFNWHLREDYRYDVALFQEFAELIDTFNWKWWKDYKSVPKVWNFYIELVDIWHFLMSAIIKEAHYQGLYLREVSKYMAAQYMEIFFLKSKRSDGLSIERLISYSRKFFNEVVFLIFDMSKYLFSQYEASDLEDRLYYFYEIYKKFLTLCWLFDFDIIKLYLLYNGKNILNRLRWEYKFPKKVGEVEDNFVLWSVYNKILDSVDSKETWDVVFNRFENILIDMLKINGFLEGEFND